MEMKASATAWLGALPETDLVSGLMYPFRLGSASVKAEGGREFLDTTDDVDGDVLRDAFESTGDVVGESLGKRVAAADGEGTLPLTFEPAELARRKRAGFDAGKGAPFPILKAPVAGLLVLSVRPAMLPPPPVALIAS